MSLIPTSYWKSKGVNSFLDPADYPTYGWSFWKRRSTYSGPCIRVARTSDNVQQDIGFGSNNFLDTGALLSFVGSSTGFVKIFYDQFGSINLADPVWQTSNSTSPRIVNNGVLETFLNGQAAMRFGIGTSGGWNTLQGGSGTDMMALGNATSYWNEENSTSQSTLVGGNNINASAFALGSFVDPNTAVFVNYGVLGNYENFTINESEAIWGFENSASAKALDLYDYRSYRTTVDGPKLFATRGIGDSNGTGFSLGGRWDNIGAPFVGKLNEFLIYNNASHSKTKTFQIQSILNQSHNFYNINDFSKDLILWYDAGNSSSYPGSGTTITDLSVGGANATLVNGVSYSSADGGKWILDGVNDWIGSSGTNNFPWQPKSSDFSAEVWVKLNNNSQLGSVWSTRSPTTNAQFSILAGSIDISGNVQSSKKLSLVVQGNNSGYDWYVTTNDIIDGTWRHIIAVRINPRTLILYVNGVSQELTAVNVLNFDTPRYVDTVSNGWRSGDFGTGVGGAGAFEISIMRLYKCGLTQAQVTRNFNLEKSRYGL